MSVPDPTPPSAPPPSWARRLEKRLDAVERRQHEQHKAHENLKGKVAADAMASIHLLAGVAATVEKVQVDVLKLNNQIWGAIKQLRAKK